MKTLLTAAQMRAVEAGAIERAEATGLELMERAGEGVVSAVLGRWPELAGKSGRAVVLCGPGNNGGDGYVVARLLADRGWNVSVLAFGSVEKLPPDAAENHRRWRAKGEVAACDAAAVAQALHAPADLVIDALFGTGTTRGLGPELRAIAAAVRTARGEAKRVAVDAPSGLCLDSGRVLGTPGPDACFAADLTVSFHAEKLGHRLAQGPQMCGEVRVADIGLDGPPPDTPGVVCLAEPDIARLRKSPFAHKYAYGHALVLAGGPGRGGAGRLAARAALRVGAGLVTLGCPPEAAVENASQLTAVMQASIADADALARVLTDARKNALCLGPGLGLDDNAAALVAAALAAGRATVLDADAVRLVGERPELKAALHAACLMTPHDGEFAHAFPALAERLREPAERGPAWSRVDAVRAAAAEAGCTILLKGPDTVIAAPGGQCVVHSAHYDRAVPWLATAGAGDTLAGLATGLMARGYAPLDAAANAAWLHVESARMFGPGLIAEDLAETLPQVFRAIGV